MISLQDKVAIVTGSGSGIGRAIANIFARLGAKVVIADINADSAQEASDALLRSGAEAFWQQVDVSDEASVQSLVHATVRTFGRIDILVNNAGVELFKSLEHTNLQEWKKVMDVDLQGVFLCSKHAIPHMKSQKRGCILHIASNHAVATIEDIDAYTAAKGGVNAMTRSMAMGLGPFGITVNCILPGFITTTKVEAFLETKEDPEELRQYYTDIHPVKRMGTPEDVGHLAAFLSSDQATFITGASVVIDGGLSIKLF